jgi:pyruvate-formate lyase-activating enzyme
MRCLYCHNRDTWIRTAVKKLPLTN